MIENLTEYEKGLIERLGTWLTIWYPSTPKTYGLYFMRDFLEENNAWQKFLTNFHMVGKRKGFTQVFEFILHTHDITNLLQWAFVWTETPEGQAYWSKLDKQLADYLKLRKADGYDLCQKYSREESKISTLFKNSVENACSILSMLANSKKGNRGKVVHHTKKLGFATPKTTKLPFTVPLTSTTIVSLSVTNE